MPSKWLIIVFNEAPEIRPTPPPPPPWWECGGRCRSGRSWHWGRTARHSPPLSPAKLCKGSWRVGPDEVDLLDHQLAKTPLLHLGGLLAQARHHHLEKSFQSWQSYIYTSTFSPTVLVEELGSLFSLPLTLLHSSSFSWSSRRLLLCRITVCSSLLLTTTLPLE